MSDNEDNSKILPNNIRVVVGDLLDIKVSHVR